MRAALRASYAGYLVVVCYLVFTPGSKAPGGPIELIHDLLPFLSYSFIERALNVALFVPFSLLGHFVVTRASVLRWTVAGACLSAGIELVQLAIPGRTTSISDVLMNTAGAALGAVLAIACVSWGTRHRG